MITIDHNQNNVNYLLDAALKYAAKGWPVLPLHWPEDDHRCSCGNSHCQNSGKHPLGKLVPNGQNSATKNPEIIKQWWGDYPRANIGIATGLESSLLVIDVDPRNGGHPDRLSGNLPMTPTVFTGGGGWHYYLVHPGEGIKFPAKMPGCEGVDLKADGGYVLAPPSIHVSGRPYSWQISPDNPLARCPQWLIEVIQRFEPRTLLPPSAGLPTPFGTPYGRAALRNELLRLAQAPEGDRNNALNRVAFSLGRLVAAGHLNGSTVTGLLETIGANIGLEAREVESTLRSGLKAGKEVAHV